MGIHKEVRKAFGASVQNYIIAARTAQVYEHWKSSTQEERLDIIQRWYENKAQLQSERQKILEEGPDGQGTGHLSPRGFLQTRHLSFDERKKLHEERKARREQEKNKVYGERGSSCPFCRKLTPHQHHRQSLDGNDILNSNMAADTQNPDFEEAIKASVAATSRGNPEEDLMIERAIRASIRELQQPGGSGPALSEQEALDRAIQASVAEATRGRTHNTEKPSLSSSDADYDAALEKCIKESLLLSQQNSRTGDSGTLVVDSDDDEDVKRAIKASKAINEEHLSKVKTEEEIVLEYVKRQSLAEEEHRKALQKRQNGSQLPGEEDSDLKKAIEESLKNEQGSSTTQLP